jgi:hypothetical protein
MSWSAGVFTRTNGTYSGASVWASDAAAAIKIQSSRHDTHDQDIAQGINACVAKDGSNTATLLKLSGTVNSASGVIYVGTVVLASTYGTSNAFFGGAGNFTMTGVGKNVAAGASSLVANTTGAGNVAVGYGSLAANTTGTSNVALGYLSMNVSTTASGNISIGDSSLLACTTGLDNVAVGGLGLCSVTTGGHNAVLGTFAAQSVTTGSYNVSIGDTALGTVTTGSQNVAIGKTADVPSASADGQLSLQNALYGVSNTGVSSTPSTGNLGVYVQAPTARLHFPAGTAAAGTAPLKLTAGTNLTTPENGALEFDGNNLFITIGGVRKTVTVT